jgi:hypothetical protein
MTHRGCWIVCRSCLFPVRLPYTVKPSFRLQDTPSLPILLACPVCANVWQYDGIELKAIAFRIPDPFRQKKATLYVVEVPCRIPRCGRMIMVYTVASTGISITSLLDVWKHWVIRADCRSHAFKARQLFTWGVYGVH